METGCITQGVEEVKHFNYCIHYCSGHTNEEKEQARQAACQAAMDAYGGKS